MEILKAKKINKGDTIGIFTPSSPSYIINEGLFLNGIKNIEKLGFKIKLGFLAKKRAQEGYRSGSGQERAQEFMELIKDDDVSALISCIGGTNSSSLIPYLDFDCIRKKQKIICGYSDVTSLHLAILKYSRLRTLYGPALMTWFGEYPNGIKESSESFLKNTMESHFGERVLKPFPFWSNHIRNWSNDDWKNQKRKWKKNSGWKVLNPGYSEGEIIVANLNTLLSAAGTDYFPDLERKILLVEEMDAPWSLQERSFRQLQLMGIFEKISGLVIGKAEKPNNEGAVFGLNELILEIVGERSYPIVSEFDCSHTVPMHSIAENSKVSLDAKKDYNVVFKTLEAYVEE